MLKSKGTIYLIIASILFWISGLLNIFYLGWSIYTHGPKPNLIQSIYILVSNMPGFLGIINCFVGYGLIKRQKIVAILGFILIFIQIFHSLSFRSQGVTSTIWVILLFMNAMLIILGWKELK